jgi:HD superfamily phosphodiesterase
MERIKYVMDYLNKNLLLLHDTGYVFDDAGFDEMIHSYGVAYFCSAIAHSRKLNPEIAYIIGLIHDLGRIVNDDYTKAHGPAGSIIAEDFLKNSGLFDGEEIEIIISAVSNHSKKKKVQNPYDEVVKDADLIERIFFLGEDKTISLEKQSRIINELRNHGLKLTGE